MAQDGWFVFQDSRSWRQRFLKRGFGHVFFLGRDKYNWFTINPLERYCDFAILGKPITERVDLLAKEQYTKVVYIEFTRNLVGIQASHYFGLPNCTHAAAYMTGLRGKMTPYRFYKALLKMRYSHNYPLHVLSIKEIERCQLPPLPKP